ncbi:hypothetical protein MLD38_029115 [Melastoma candidum]|uniref:Uncharacterized protein n=1 Tax=Melastoma candidum TaxID=119954 RepID=A0ACB9N3W2_9MYRT|nr:hypothetical protein MLD38_029115 [Melastoma candidum]
MMAFRDSDRCPDATVPIRRVAIQDERTSEYRLDGYDPKTKDSGFRRAVEGINLPPEDSFCGGTADISILNPPCKQIQQ